MSIPVRCSQPSCGAEFTLAEHTSGKPIRCPRCQQTVPSPSPSSGNQDSTSGLPSHLQTNNGNLGQIGRFQLQKQLGAGAFGAVYLALDPQLKREVALKVPQPWILEHPTAGARFVREARASARLRHPHIVPVYDVGRDRDQLYIASAFIRGQTLSNAVEAGPLGPERAARIVHDLAEALAYAHQQGIIHRDVKPDNILLDERDRPSLMDFGLAYLDDQEKLTNEGAVMGTPEYMAPEQAGGATGNPLPASDQYSLGVVLYELLTGDTPFHGPPAIVVYNVLNSEPPRPRSLRADIPADLETICLKAMAREPDQRYPDCQHLADDLGRWLDDEPIHARTMPPYRKLRRWFRRNPVLALSLSLVTVALLITILTAAMSTMFFLQKKAQATEARQLAERRQAKARQAREEAEAQARKAKDALQKVRDQTNETKKAALEAVAAARKERDALEEQRKLRDRAQETLALLKKALAAKKATQEKKSAQEKARLALLQKQRALPILSFAISTDCESNLPLRAASPALALGDGRLVTLWNLPTGKKVSTRGAHFNEVTTLAFNSKGTQLASGSRDGVVKVWEMGNNARRPLATYKHNQPVTALAFSSSGQLLASGTATTRSPKGGALAAVWNSTTGKELALFRGQPRGVRCLAFHPDGKRVVSGGQDGSVQLWDAFTGKVLRQLPAHSHPVTAVAFSADGKLFASCAREIKLCELATGKVVRTLPGDRAIQFHPKGKLLASAVGSDVVVYQLTDGEEWLRFRSHTAPVVSLAFHKDGTQLVSLGADHTVKVWNTAPVTTKDPTPQTDQPAKVPGKS